MRVESLCFEVSKATDLGVAALLFSFVYLSSVQAQTEDTGVDSSDNACEISLGTSDESIVAGNLVRGDDAVAPDESIVAGNLVRGEDAVAPGAVLISDGKVTKVSTKEEVLAAAPNATLFDCKNSFISPGFINPHEHLSHSGGIPDHNAKPVYEHRDEWRGVFGEEYAVKFHSVEEHEHHIWVELRHLVAGTTTIGSSGGVEGLVKNATNEVTDDGYLIDYEIFPYGWVSRFHGMDCSDQLTDTTPQISDVEGVSTAPYVAHIAEGTNCAATLEGRAFLDYVEQHPKRRYSLIHGVGLDSESVGRLKQLDVTLIWAPRSNIALYDKTINVVNVLETGARVALGSDWSFSGSYNMLEEIQCADRIDNVRWEDQLSGKDYWTMSTQAAAYSLGLENVTGRLEEGYAADIVVLKAHTDDFFADLLTYDVTDVVATFVDGELRSGFAPAFNKSELPARCQHYIDRHFVCEEWSSEEMSIEELVRANRLTKDFVPLFEPRSQAACLKED